MILLLVATVAAAGYFIINRESSGSHGISHDFASTARRVAKNALAVPEAARSVQRFTELQDFDGTSRLLLIGMQEDVARLSRFAATTPGRGGQIAQQAVAEGEQAIAAVQRYRQAVAFTYRLSNAAAAEHDLDVAALSLNEQAKAWAHR